MSPTLLCFSIFLISALFFLAINFKSLLKHASNKNLNYKHIAIVNITTFGCWYLTIYPLKFLEPAIVAAVILSTLPIATFFCNIILVKDHRQINFRELIIVVLLFLGIFLFFQIIRHQKTGLVDTNTTQQIIAFIGCIGSGIFLSINNIFSKKLSINGLSPIDILSIRFWLMIVITFFASKDLLGHVAHLATISQIIMLAVSLIILPQIIFQISLKELEPLTISIISPLKPILVFIFEIFDAQLSLTIWTISCIIFTTIVSITGTLLKFKSNLSTRKTT